MTEPTRMTAIVRGAGPDGPVRRCVDDLARQARVAVDIVIVHPPGWRDLAGRLDSTAVRFIEEAGWNASAINRTVDDSTSELFTIVQPDDRIHPEYLASAFDALASAPGKGYTVVPSSWHPGIHESALAALLAGPQAYVNAVYRRAAWFTAGKFADSITDLFEWELLVRLEARGAPGTVLWDFHGDSAPDPPQMPWRMRPGADLEDRRRVVAVHRDLFLRHMAETLVAQERMARTLWARERDLSGRRRDAEAALARATEGLREIRDQLGPLSRATLEWQDLRRTRPISRRWGFDRGRPVDRYYIEGFLDRHRSDIAGRVLEVLDDTLTVKYGEGRVTRADVLDIDAANPRASLIADLRLSAALPEAAYDCFILTQTLHLIDDMRAAVRSAYRMLKPGGVLLATLPAVSMAELEAGDRWRVTGQGARDLFDPVFGPSRVHLEVYGNVLSAAAFLYGLASHELAPAELDDQDERYPVLLAIRAQKPGVATTHRGGAGQRSSTIVLYHRVADVAADPYQLAVSPQVFRAQLESLSRVYEIVPLTALMEGSAIRRSHGGVALTFDDGYVDNLQTALPILREMGLPATFFLTTESCGSTRGYWWDILQRAVFDTGRSSSTLVVRLRGERREFLVDNAEARRCAHDELYTLLKASAPVVRDDIVLQLRASIELTDRELEAERPLSDAEIRELAAVPGVDIGAHTVHHLSLPALAGESLFREVSECRTRLQALSGRTVTSFAYPFGDLSPVVVDMVATAGYRLACTCEARSIGASEHPLRLPRIQAPPSSSAALMQRLQEAAPRTT